VRGVIPAKGERAPDELPVPPDRFVTPHLVLGPAQGMFDLLVTLLDPHPQPVQSDHLFQTGSSEEGWRRWELAGW
jgi:hypothetical protein